MICAKCFYLNNHTDLVSLEWWIKLNKLIGYDKIQFCNQTISNDKLFEKYGQFLDISNLNKNVT